METTQQQWLASLRQEDEFLFIEGELIANREKAVAFQIKDHTTIWIPRSLIKDFGNKNELDGLWIKEWFIKKKLDDIFNVIDKMGYKYE